MRACSVDGCVRPLRARGLCNTHWARMHRRGTLELAGRGMRLDRFMTYVEPEPNSGCWLHIGVRKRTPEYGVYGRMHAHRYAYTELRGPIPPGMTLDHLCRVRCCVNPAHLEPVTGIENVRRGVSPTAQNARKTHCPHGHPLDGINTNRASGHQTRFCRACHRIRNAN